MKKTIVTRLVKSEDLNNHGTLFAGRAAEWFVEASFLNGAEVTGHQENIVFRTLHDFKFYSPAPKGAVVRLESFMVKVGTTSFTTYCKILVNGKEKPSCEGFITFVYVDENGKKMPHNLVLDETTDTEELQRREEAQSL